MKTLEDVVRHYTQEFISNSRVSQASFICEYLFPALTKAGIEEAQEILTADDYEDWVAAKRRQMSSILRSKQNAPLKWLLPWMECLPEPYKSSCRKDLLTVLGVMDIPRIENNNKNSQRSNLPKLLRETAEVLEASSNVVANGKYDKDDAPEELERTANELFDVIELCMSEVLSINQVKELEGRARTIVRMFK